MLLVVLWLEMGPKFLLFNLKDGCRMYLVECGEIFGWDVRRSDVDHIGFRKLAITITDPLGEMPALSIHIVHIVTVCTEKEVIRINAWRIVAFVEDIHALWNFAIGQFPDNSMGDAVLSADTYSAIIKVTAGTLPDPARICEFDLPKNSIWDNHSKSSTFRSITLADLLTLRTAFSSSTGR